MTDRVSLQENSSGEEDHINSPETDRREQPVSGLLSDHGSLEEWVQPAHLRPGILKSYRDEFRRHPLRLLVIKNVLHHSAAMELSVFLDHEAHFNRRYGLYSTAHQYESVSEVSEEEWLKSEEPDRFYQFGDYGGAALEYENSVNFLRFQKFFYFLRSPEFKAMMDAMSGLNLGPPLINAYRYEAGDFLKVHDDDARDKHLSFIFYLSPDWQPGLGGILHMTQAEGEALRIAPDFNSLVVFDVTNNAEHYISAVESNAGNRARLSISGWFRKFGAPQRPLPPSSPSLA